ncbi:MAG: septal ring lytic transglycosylase RlpA family protein [Holosporaceae bacterium]
MIRANFWQRTCALWVCAFVLSGCVCKRTTSPTRYTSKPYKIKGRWYYPQKHYELHDVGLASYYGGPDGTHGLPTASGEKFSMYRMTAAHKTLPLPCVVRVTNLANGRQVVLKVNDRGPFKPGRVIDVSTVAAKKLGFYKKGVTRVRVETLVGRSLSLKENRKRCPKGRC